MLLSISPIFFKNHEMIENCVSKIHQKAIAESTAPKLVAVRELATVQRQVALDVLDRMIDPSAVSR